MTQRNTSPNDLAKASKNEACGSCKKTVRDNQKSMLCGLCDRWFHASCQGISDDVYDVIRRDSNTKMPQIHWYCNSSCNILATSVIGNIAKLQNDVNKLADEVTSVDDRVSKIEEGKFPQSMVKALKTLQQEAQAEKAPLLESEELEKMMDKKAKKLAAEAEDRARRKSSLMIFRLDELQSMSDDEKKRADEISVTRILSEIRTKHQPVDIRRLRTATASALGREDQNKKPRPVRVTFASQTARDDVLKSFNLIRKDKKLDERDDDSRLCYKISLRRDMTPAERKEDDDLFKELKIKQEQSKQAGDDCARWVRRSGQVINIGKYPHAPLPAAEGQHNKDPA